MTVSEPKFTMGVEEEYLLVDKETSRETTDIYRCAQFYAGA